MKHDIFQKVDGLQTKPINSKKGNKWNLKDTCMLLSSLFSGIESSLELRTNVWNNIDRDKNLVIRMGNTP